MFFDKFTRKVEIEGTLRCLTALRIGVGRGSTEVSATDLPILKDAAERPLIPGSSIKGVMRSAMESILRAIPAETSKDQRWACDPFTAPCVKPKDDAPNIDQRSAAERAARQRDRLRRGLCRICRTFGAPGLASHVLFRDARALGKVHIERRDGVAIDRDLGRVSGARKYDFEVVAEGTTFAFGLSIDSAEPWQEGIVVLGIDLLKDGFARIGGATSRGLGLVTFDDLTVKVLEREQLMKGEKARLVDWAGFQEHALGAWRRHVEESTAREEG